MIVDLAGYLDGARIEAPADLATVPTLRAHAGVCIWLGLRMPEAGELLEMASAFGWPEFPVNDVLAPHTRPVLSVEPWGVRLVARTARYNDARELVSLGEITMVLDDRSIVSIRYGQASPLGSLREELEADPARLRGGPYAVLAAILGRIIDDYGPALDGFEHDVIEAERDVFSDSRRRPIKRIYDLKRQVRDLSIAVEALRDPLARLIRTSGHRIDPTVLPEFLEVSEQLERVIRRTHSLSELLDAALGATLAQISVQQNDDMRRISAWVAIAAGPTMIAGIYGMNFEHFPELRWRFGYPLVLGVMVALMIGLFRAFRSSGWL